MGAYSQMDAELRYGGDAFVDDEADEGCPAFVPDETEDNAIPAFEDDDGQGQELEPAPDPQPVPVQPDGRAQAAAQPDANDAAKAAVNKAADEDAKRKAHEEAEAKRKAEWDAKQAQKKAEEQKKLDELAAMSDEELMAASTQRVSADTEKLTRRNMKECVTEHIQTMCLDDPAFARKVMHPRKSMIRCFQYINRKAWEYVQDEMKANGIKPGPGQQAYASDIPDGLCYQWAVDYFNDPDVKEDHVDEEKFVPQPYRGATTSTSKKTASKGKGKSTEKSNGAKGAAQKDAKPAAPKKQDDGGQISFGNFAMPEEKAG